MSIIADLKDSLRKAIYDETGLINDILPAENIGRSQANTPVIVENDNLQYLSFAMGDEVFIKFPVPTNYVSGGVIITPVWTNDGGVDDLNKDVKCQIDYQVAATGEATDGNHANSPRSQEDTYTSVAGWIEHRFEGITIPDAEIDIMECIFIKLSFIAPVGVALTCNPHLIGICLTYLGYLNRLA